MKEKKFGFESQSYASPRAEAIEMMCDSSLLASSQVPPVVNPMDYQRIDGTL